MPRKISIVTRAKSTGVNDLPFILLLVIGLLAAGCVTGSQEIPGAPAGIPPAYGSADNAPVASTTGYATGTPGHILDMTYPFDNASIYWPNAQGFSLEPESAGMTDKGYWYAANFYSASEHGGTHADAPRHFAKDGRTIDQVPLAEWIGPAVVIDVRDQCARDRDYLLSVADIEHWEQQHGRIPAGAWVIMYTGFDTQWYPDPVKVMGTDKKGLPAIPYLSFPGFSKESAEFLTTQRTITGIALDTPSMDYGKSQDFPVHRVICGADKLALENIANLDKLPPSGATLYVIPTDIRGATGAPARVFAIIP